MHACGLWRAARMGGMRCGRGVGMWLLIQWQEVWHGDRGKYRLSYQGRHGQSGNLERDVGKLRLRLSGSPGC